MDSSVSQVRPTIGISAQDITEGEKYSINGQSYTAGKTGVIVAEISATGGAYGVLQIGDIIVGIANKSIRTMDELQQQLYQYKVGDTVTLRVWRNNAELELSIKLGVKQ